MNGKFYENIEEVLKDCTLYELAIAEKVKKAREERIYSKSYTNKKKKEAEAEQNTEEKDPYIEFKKGKWPVSDWSDFSLKINRDEYDIRRRAIIDSVYNNEMICLAYIAQYSQLTLPFIKELLFIASPFFKFEYYNIECIEWYSMFLDSNKSDRKKIMRSYLNDKVDIPFTDSKNYETVKEFIKYVGEYVIKRNWVSYSKLDIFTLLEYQNIGDKIYNTYKDFIDTSIKNASSGRMCNSKFQTIINEIKVFGCSRYAPKYGERRRKILSNPRLKTRALDILGYEYFQMDNENNMNDNNYMD